MNFRIEPDSHVPVYLQIVDIVRSSIAAGVHKPGESLPSQRVLAAELRVNPNTVQRAFDEMLRQGLIKSQRGVGMFVASRGPHSARGRAEEAAQAAFLQAVTSASQAGLTPDRIRELFEDAMEELETKSGGRR
jgi:GntR family transcriptional regulator